MRKILILLMSLLTINMVYGLTCDFRDEPLLKINDKMEFICKTNESKCLSYVKFNERLLQVNPKSEQIKEIGVIDKFQVNSGIVKPYFTKKNLRDNTNFTFGVICGNETFEVNVTPKYKDLYEPQDQSLRLIENSTMLILLFILMIMGIGLSFFIIRTIRGK